MPNFALAAGAASESTLTNRTCCICAAALAKFGAIVLQGPHQAAQKSTSTGISVWAMYRGKLASSSAIGVSGNNADLQRAHTGPECNRSCGRRLIVAQFGQTKCMRDPIYQQSIDAQLFMGAPRAFATLNLSARSKFPHKAAVN